MLYLDSSALVKLVVIEPESAALREYAGRRAPWAASVLASVETRRATRLHDVGPAVAAAVLSQLNWVELNESILERAAFLNPPALRTLDAIHVASALSIREAIDGLVTYDGRMREAAEHHGLTVVSPGA